MWAIITIAIIAGLIALIVIVFCIPVDMTFSVERYEKLQTRVRVIWLFGLVHKELGTGKKISAREKRKQRPGIRTIIEILRTKGFLRRIAYLLKGVVKSVRMKELKVYFRVGLDDAADTGILFSIFGSAVSLFDYFSRYSVRLEPSFTDEAVFEGYLNGVVRLQPISLVPPFTRFVFSRPTLKVIKILFLSRWRKKKL